MHTKNKQGNGGKKRIYKLERAIRTSTINGLNWEENERRKKKRIRSIELRAQLIKLDNVREYYNLCEEHFNMFFMSELVVCATTLGSVNFHFHRARLFFCWLYSENYVRAVHNDLCDLENLDGRRP